MTMGTLFGGNKPSGPFWQVKDPAFWAGQQASSRMSNFGGNPLLDIASSAVTTRRGGLGGATAPQSVAGGGFGRQLGTGAGALQSGAGKSLLG